jgi:hypothetical protein
MNKFYPDETERCGVLLEILQTCGLEIHHPGFIEDTKIYTDDHHLCKSNPTIILEVNNETVSTGTDSTEPSFQVLLYYDTFVREHGLWKDMSSIHPCFIITLAGKPPPQRYFWPFLSCI